MSIFLLVSIFSSVQAADLESLMQQGNALYQQEQYPEAIASYQQILANGYESGALHYNLGCAFFKIDELGLAMLHFHQAQRLLPRDDDVKRNLEYARVQRQDRFDLPEPMPAVKTFINLRKSMKVSELQILTIGFWLLFVVSVIVYRRNRHRAMANGIFITSAALGIIFLILGGWLMDRSLDARDVGVVILSESANGHSAPINNSEILFVVHEGTEGQVVQRSEEWIEVRLPDGKEAWLEARDLGTF